LRRNDFRAVQHFVGEINCRLHGEYLLLYGDVVKFG
jgi:hypothetical protein